MITSLAGENRFGLKSELDKRIQGFVGKHGDIAVEKIDASEAEFDTILGSLQSPPFLSAKKLCVIHDLSLNKQAAEQIETILDAPSDEVELIIVEGKLDKRGVYYKTLKKQPGFQEFNEPDEFELANWLVQTAKDLGASLSRQNASYLFNRVQGSQQQMASELAKLAGYNKEITRENIDLLVEPTPQGNVFNLLDAAFAGQAKKASDLYESLRLQKVEPQLILAMVVRQMNIVCLMHAAGDKSIDEINRDSKINPYVLRKSQQIKDRLSRADIIEILDKLCDLDRRFKSEKIDVDQAMKLLILELG